MLEKIGAMIAGSTLLAVGINLFLAPYHLLDGGLIGIGLLINYYSGFPAGLSMLLASIPLYLYAWRNEKKLFFNSLHGLLFSSIFIDLFAGKKVPWDLPLFANAVIGGAIIGLGIGLMLRYEVSTGGTDLLAQMISSKMAVNVGVVIFIIDGAVIICGLGLVGITIFLYSCLTILTVGLLTSVTMMDVSGKLQD
ncbi:Uncharacterised 5xTM membrane BCR, YitT family COG1284 [Bacillus sp. OV322]|uniref:YitT family protein n=1 Tax=Bacillus sp. OV322 TaxID=1882764 RepID=UPI0008E03DFD|nr:YitT family protein [Bacillus sp. OV322]SFB93836.1 Uncharacterised 5xTM membrane BCR, YitT family COG1284 [Bacillus sp. OV322]